MTLEARVSRTASRRQPFAIGRAVTEARVFAGSLLLAVRAERAGDPQCRTLPEFVARGGCADRSSAPCKGASHGRLREDETSLAGVPAFCSLSMRHPRVAEPPSTRTSKRLSNSHTCALVDEDHSSGRERRDLPPLLFAIRPPKDRRPGPARRVVASPVRLAAVDRRAPPR